MRFLGLVGLVGALALLAAGNLLGDIVTVNGDSVRDLQFALGIARGWLFPRKGPSVPWMNFWLGPHWYYVLAGALRVTGSAWSLVALRWVAQAASAVGLFVLAGRLRGPFAAAVALTLFLVSPVTVAIFDWFTHPILALPLALWAMVLVERWVADEDARAGVAALFLTSLTLQFHFASAAVLLTLLAAGVLLARPMSTGRALHAVVAFVVPFLLTRAWMPWDRIVLPIVPGISASVVPLGCVALFMALWRGGTGRRAPVHAAALAVLAIWLGRMYVIRPHRPLDAVHFFNVRVGLDPWRSVAGGDVAWADVLTGTARAFFETYLGPTTVRWSERITAVAGGVAALGGLASVAREVLRGGRATVGGRRAGLLLLWLAFALPLALATGRHGVRERYFIVLLPCLAALAGVGAAAALELLPFRPNARARFGAVAAVALWILPLDSFETRMVGARGVRSDPSRRCAGELLTGLRFADALRSRARSLGAPRTRLHGELDREGAMLDHRDSLLPLAWALDGAPDPRSTRADDATHWRIGPATDAAEGDGCPFVLTPFVSALHLGGVRVLSGPTAGSTLRLPARGPSWTESIEMLERRDPHDWSNRSIPRDLELRRRPGASWPAGIAIVANGRGRALGSTCPVEVEAGAASVQEIPTRTPTRTLLVVRALPPSVDALRIHLRECAFEYLDAWDLAPDESP